ncbi:MFS transporter [Demequina sp. NBRC 110051]|uniref:MFS transporter n=1 Tax=Demequina sp. NBRC 110051 TaxID=1570340 RepID=UPI0009FFAFD7|nr:glycoside-pentoside-hexuronide (GPH):cation symporter [Demequina sp. NBRC 110051]
MTSAASVVNKGAHGSTKKAKPFGWSDRIGYMFGDFGNDFTFILQAMLFMAFYTKVIGVEAAHVGTLLLVARLIDGFTDVGVGRFLDTRQPGRHGKFRPWLLRGAIPVAAASALMYMNFVSGWESYGARVAWMSITYILWGSIAYTLVNIPYGSMASVMTTNPDQRAQLSVFRSTGAMLAAIVISVAVPMFVNVTDADGNSVLSGERMQMVAIALSILALGAYALAFLMTRERVEEPPAKEVVPFREMITSVLRSKPLRGLVVSALLLLVGSLLPSGLVAYLWLDYFNRGDLQSIAALAGFVPTLLLLPLVPWLAKKFGKREASVVSLILGSSMYILAWVLGLQDQPMVFIALFTIANFCMAMFNFMVWAFITDVIDDHDVETGDRDDATIYGIYSWARKLGQALAGGLGGWALGWVGYQATTGSDQIVQAQETLDGIYMLSTLVPGVLLILVALSLRFLYPLSKKVVDANAAVLAERRAAQASMEASESPK